MKISKAFIKLNEAEETVDFENCAKAIGDALKTYATDLGFTADLKEIGGTRKAEFDLFIKLNYGVIAKPKREIALKLVEIRDYAPDDTEYEEEVFSGINFKYTTDIPEELDFDLEMDLEECKEFLKTKKSDKVLFAISQLIANYYINVYSVYEDKI